LILLNREEQEYQRLAQQYQPSTRYRHQCIDIYATLCGEWLVVYHQQPHKNIQNQYEPDLHQRWTNA
jgi:hypothetical protein